MEELPTHFCQLKERIQSLLALSSIFPKQTIAMKHCELYKYQSKQTCKVRSNGSCSLETTLEGRRDCILCEKVKGVDETLFCDAAVVLCVEDGKLEDER